MKVPNAGAAFIDRSKLVDYCLSPDHPRGKHKAQVFAAVLGITRENAVVLEDALLEAIRTQEAQAGNSDEYGIRYIVTFAMTTEVGQATVMSVWIIRTGEIFPRLVTAYVSD